MVLLPIVDRELRVAARRPETYWMRALAALLILIVGAVLLIGGHNSSPSQMGAQLIIAMTVPAIGFAVFSGVFLTADCLSEEKREGTLGLLFLTDLKGYDVIFGKIAARSLHAFFGLLAIFPLLAMPLLLGGVTGKEFSRLLLILTVTMVFSLSLGILISSLCHEARQAMSRTFLWLVLLSGVGPAIWWLLYIYLKRTVCDWLLLPSPIYAYIVAFDAQYRSVSGNLPPYWQSIILLSALSIVCLLLANFILPRVWHGNAMFPRFISWRIPLWKRAPVLGPVRCRRCFFPFGANPIYWLSSRDTSSRKILLRLALLLIPIWLIALVLSLIRSRPQEAFTLCFFTAYAANVAVKVVLALEASRRLNEDRQSGALELLMVTPIRIPDVLQGMRLALLHRFLPALATLAALNIVMSWTAIVFAKRLRMSGDDLAIFLEIFIGGLILLAADFHAIIWVGMFRALKQQRHNRAVVSTILQIMGIPWAAVFFMFCLASMGVGPNRQSAIAIFIALWIIGGVVLDAASAFFAKEQLQSTFRRLMAQRTGKSSE